MKNRMLADEAKGGLPDNPAAHTLEAVTAWLDGDMSGCVKKNPKKMEMIIRGIIRSVNPANGQELSKDDIKEKLSEFIENECVSKIFKKNEQNQKEYTGARIAPMAVDPIVCSGKHAFEKQIDGILNTVMKEEKKAQNPAAKDLGRKK